MNYDHKIIEKKWQDIWEREKTFAARGDSSKKKSYLLIEFPYPSGEGLHVGHLRSYTAMDVLARKRRMQNENVLFPIGYDAFGLPTENFAIKTGQPPALITEKNIANFRHQLKSIGYSFDWDREVTTSDPAYYKWTQWIFSQLYKHGLAYKDKIAINWCPKDKIGLANEEVIAGKCERCGTEVEQREKEQWMLKITAYADRLLKDLDLVNFLPRIRSQQENWIGQSEGAEVRFSLTSIPGQEDRKHFVDVFTTRIDTIFGATFLVIAPELAQKWLDVGWQASDEVKTYIATSLKSRELDRAEQAAKEKTGVFTGVYAINPATEKEIPVWVADYVLGAYGTGAIMAVPAHDERDFAFAKKFDLPIIPVVRPASLATIPLAGIPNLTPGVPGEIRVESECWIGEEGELVNSNGFDGMSSEEAKKAIAEKIDATMKTQYKLRDWVFSRQRYWGDPIPMVHCENDGWVPVPEDQLPVVLPQVEKYQPTDNGESPLATVTDWVNTTCPTCGGPAKRETDTMPNWAGSSWYYLRYIDPKNDKVLADAEKMKHWLPVDWYNGGMEHTTLHLLYSRFWHKFLFDIGVVPTAEPYAKRTSHGMILGPDGQKMSKSRGNVVNPDDVVATCGADTTRLYELFMGPFAEAIPWSSESIAGVRRFLERVWHIAQDSNPQSEMRNPQSDRELKRMVAKTVKKVTEDIETFSFNTAISAMMELVNYLFTIREQAVAGKDEAVRNLLLILYPFAPHITAELWGQTQKEQGMIWEQSWPSYNEADLVQDTVNVVVQVNGKVRGTITLSAAVTEEEQVAAAKAEPNVAKWLEGKTIIKIIAKVSKLVNFVVAE